MQTIKINDNVTDLSNVIRANEPVIIIVNPIVGGVNLYLPDLTRINSLDIRITLSGMAIFGYNYMVTPKDQKFFIYDNNRYPTLYLEHYFAYIIHTDKIDYYVWRCGQY